MSEPIIELKNVYKDYYVYDSNMKRALGMLFKRKPKATKHALKDITITINKGDRVAIMGRSQSGRTSLAKIISGVFYQTKGKVKVKGTVNALLSRKVAFDYKCTCRENIYLKAIANGIPKNEIKKYEEETLEYSGAGKFADLPMKQAQPSVVACMALAIHLKKKADILVIDEGMGYGGDEARFKIEKSIAEYLEENKDVTAVMSRQYLTLMKAVCNRAIVLEKGEIVYDG